jgi:hypothetical protein
MDALDPACAARPAEGVLRGPRMLTKCGQGVATSLLPLTADVMGGDAWPASPRHAVHLLLYISVRSHVCMWHGVVPE